MSRRIISIPAKTLIKVFEKIGFTVSRQKGSHIQMIMSGRRTVVIQSSNSVPIDHIMANIKTAGISRDEYLNVLDNL